MAKKRLNPAIKRSRTRSGCLTCRDRHMKCDEQKPVCRNCIKSKRKCFRGVRLNFTQYTIYNPEDDEMSRSVCEYDDSNFKLLDQSITIASLYHNGRRPYEPYLHLHSQEDLNESDLQFQRDIYATFPQGSPEVSPQVSIEPEHDQTKVRRNDHVANLLLREKYIPNRFFQPAQASHSQPQSQPHTTQHNPQSQPQSQPHSHSPLLTMDLPHDVPMDTLVGLIENEKYHWLLDLFNGLDIWKSRIPAYCMKQYSQSAGKRSVLISGLLNCSRLTRIDIDHLLATQAHEWDQVRAMPLSDSTMVYFEQILIGVALLILSVELKAENLSDSLRTMLGTQFRIFTSITYKLHGFNPHDHILATSAIHAIFVLKYFLIKKFLLEREFHVANSKADNTYSALSPMLVVSDFEAEHLDAAFSSLDLPAAKTVNWKEHWKSDASHLRKSTWNLIKMNYCLLISPTESPDSLSSIRTGVQPSRDYKGNIPFSPPVETVKLGWESVPSIHGVILPQERGTVACLIREYMSRLKNVHLGTIPLMGVDEATFNIEQIMKSIESSTVDLRMKMMWKRHFTWMLYEQ